MDKKAPITPPYTQIHINFKQHSYFLFTNNAMWRKPHPSSQINKDQNSLNCPHEKHFKQQVGARTDRHAVSGQTKWPPANKPHHHRSPRILQSLGENVSCLNYIHLRDCFASHTRTLRTFFWVISKDSTKNPNDKLNSNHQFPRWSGNISAKLSPLILLGFGWFFGVFFNI